ncbi:hypothetical protein GCM10009634_41690 [Saccharothrix xinjiangensis]
MRVEAVGPGVADRLRDLDAEHRLTLLDRPGPTALVVAVGDEPRADGAAADLAAPDGVWARRIGPFAGLEPPPRTPPVLAGHDPRLPPVLRDRLRADPAFRDAYGP